MGLYGYAGKILDIDLSSGTILKKTTGEKFAREYIGGMGFSSRLLFEEVGVDVDPFGPENVVYLATGPLTGTSAPCSGRMEITTKSALTGNIGSGNTGGLWGARLKQAGFDLVIIRGKAESPSYIWIDDDRVEIKQAAHLWGKNTKLTSDIIIRETDSSSPSKISVMAIGPAGENLVRYAHALNDYYHSASRSGAGAVLGSKRLKAVAVRGSGVVKIARQAEFRRAAEVARSRLLDNARAQRMPGAVLDPRRINLERGSLPGKNFQTGVMPRWLETRGIDIAQQYFSRYDGTCYACPVTCFNLVEVKEGKYAGLNVNRGLHPGLVFDWGAKCALESLPEIWKCKSVCEDLGLDYASAAGSLSFAMELYQRGIINRQDTDGLELRWGNANAMLEMLSRIAFRQGFGDILAEGSVRAARIIGGGAEKYVMATKGMEMMSHDPRTGYRGFVFGDLTSPRGGDNVKDTHFMCEDYNPHWWVDKIDMFSNVKKQIYGMPAEIIPDSWEGKAAMCKWFEDIFSVLNAAGICIFVSGKSALGPTYISGLLSACTGFDVSPEELMRLGEKVFTLLKAYNIRQGLTRKDDSWPERFFTEPLLEGPAKGNVLSKGKITQLLDEYYGLRGWDVASGLPTKDKLDELGLESIGEELSSARLLP